MDRRVVVGLVGLVLVGRAEVCPAQVGGPSRDPSAQPSVGLVPIPSIGDSINNTSVIPTTVPMASSTVPTSPVGIGPDAVIPTAPIPSNPVSLSPMDPIHSSVSRGVGSGIPSPMFRKPIVRPSAISNSGPRPRVEKAPKDDSSAFPLMWHTRPSYRPSLSAASSNPAGRPAPYADRAPELPRPQADPPVNSGAAEGRSAPFKGESPGSARPRASLDDRPQGPRPRFEPPVPPAGPGPEPSVIPPAEVVPEPTNAPAAIPVELPPPPVIEPSATPPAVPPAIEEVTPPAIEPSAEPAIESSTPPATETSATPPAVAPPPIGTDPLQGVALVPISPPPALAATPAPVLPEPVAAPAPSLTDPAVRRTSQDETAVRMKPPRPRQLPYATIRAAAVGDQIITINELATAVNDRMREMLGGQQSQMSEAELFEVKNRVAAAVLNDLINQSLILQQASSKMAKNPKAKQMFDEFTDKRWKDEEVPPLLRKTASANIHELKIKLASEGKSYDAMKESFRKKLMAREFLGAEIRNKVNADLIEMKAYYNQHLKDFEQPARMTWREVEINIARYPSRAAARQKAEEVLARLLRDEDFAAVARSVSNGPTASKGGVYIDMQPGSYGIPVVNDALNRIPIGQVSQVLEAPGSFHIIRVDSRREKGPLRFDEVQDKIKNQVLEANWQKAIDDYLAKLRAKTLIRTMFDKTASDPELARRNLAAGR